MSFLKSCLNILLKPAKDPRQSSTYTYERQQALLLKVRSLLADMTTAKQRFSQKTAVLDAGMPQLEAQARQALQAGREDIARLALQRYQIATVEQQALLVQIGEIEQEEQRLLLVEHRLVTQIEVYMARREAVAARYNTADSQVKINKALQRVFQDLADLDRIIETAEARTDQMETRASWANESVEMDQALSTAVPAAALFTEPVTYFDVDTAVEEQLARLKQQIIP